MFQVCNNNPILANASYRYLEEIFNHWRAETVSLERTERIKRRDESKFSFFSVTLYNVAFSCNDNPWMKEEIHYTHT